MLAKLHSIAVADDPACSVGEFFLQNKICLDKHTLGDRRRLDLGTSCYVSMKLNGLFVYSDHEMLVLLGVMMLFVVLALLVMAITFCKSLRLTFVLVHDVLLVI